MTVHSGSCLCKAVSYEVTGPLRNAIGCHCTQCRKMTGHYLAATRQAEAFAGSAARRCSGRPTAAITWPSRRAASTRRPASSSKATSSVPTRATTTRSPTAITSARTGAQARERWHLVGSSWLPQPLVPAPGSGLWPARGQAPAGTHLRLAQRLWVPASAGTSDKLSHISSCTRLALPAPPRGADTGRRNRSRRGAPCSLRSQPQSPARAGCRCRSAAR
jgi:hypothetical protein